MERATIMQPPDTPVYLFDGSALRTRSLNTLADDNCCKQMSVMAIFRQLRDDQSFVNIDVILFSKGQV